MQMRSLALALFGVVGLVLHTVRGQDTSADSARAIEREILSRPDTDNEIVAKSREMILDRLRAGDIAKVAEVIAYLDHRFQSRQILPLWPVERFLLAYWTHQYTEILDPPLLDSLDTSVYRDQVLPPDDLLSRDLIDLSRSRRTVLRAAVLASDRSREEQAFLTIFLGYLLTERTFAAPDQPLNDAADEFLGQYPESRYAGFVRSRIRVVFREGEWGYGFDIGGGTALPGGALGDRISDGGSLTLGLDVARREAVGSVDIVGYFRLLFSLGSSVLAPFEYNGTWKRDLSLTTMVPEFSVGPVVVENRWIQVTPFAGVSGMLIAPPENERAKPGNDVSVNLFSATGGVNIDWKIARGNLVISSPFENAYWFVRTRISYTAPLSTPDPMFRGSVIAITLSVGGFGRPIARDL